MVSETAPNSIKPRLHVQSDRDSFAEQLHREAVETLRATFDVTGERTRGSGAGGPGPPFVFVDIASPLIPLLQSVSVGLLSNALWDGLKLFLAPREQQKQRSLFEFTVHRPDDSTVRAILITDKEDILKHALDTLGNVAQLSANGGEYNEQDGTWREWEKPS